LSKEAQKIWELFKEANPDTPLKLDHTGDEITTMFVHSPLANKHDEHIQFLKNWIKENHPKSRVGVGVMMYDNWKTASEGKKKEPVEIVIDPEILNAPGQEKEEPHGN